MRTPAKKKRKPLGRPPRRSGRRPVQKSENEQLLEQAKRIKKEHEARNLKTKTTKLVSVPLVQTAQPATFLAVIAQAARDPKVDPAKMRDLLGLHRDLEKDQDRRSFHEHMAQLQGEISQIATDAANPQTSSRYASYAALDAVLRPHYTRHGFSVRFDSSMAEGNVLLVTCIVSRGAWDERATAPIPYTTKGPKGGDVMSITHAAASGLSYGKRYSLAMSFNLAVSRDDDGNLAGAKTLLPSQIAELEQLARGRDLTETFAKLEIAGWEELPRSEFQRMKSKIMSQLQRESRQ